jgi:hypothetical protein
MANLRLVISNHLPIREKRYPHIWVLHKATGTVEFRVRHGRRNPQQLSLQRGRVPEMSRALPKAWRAAGWLRNVEN